MRTNAGADAHGPLNRIRPYRVTRGTVPAAAAPIPPASTTMQPVRRATRTGMTSGCWMAAMVSGTTLSAIRIIAMRSGATPNRTARARDTGPTSGPDSGRGMRTVTVRARATVDKTRPTAALYSATGLAYH